ncbi:DUF2783 domain-containing protein [Pseudomonas protegens]|uniref:DUF2783 domain-containing protein n=1 Tax=Pseudomonas protegens TaxID=380021 RepID=UPI001C8D8061|nr:DUF2783 domain-containing protein [Pseudomonas protegens]QZI71686.1 DUF2783 domain-containing protein [Pseudomonas protegens]
MSTLTLEELEQVYDVLAQSLDKASAAKAELFLVKLALLSAQALGSAQRFNELVESALQDL